MTRIRPMQEQDLDAVLRINAATAPAAILWTRDMYAQALTDKFPGKVWVALEDGCVVGFICFVVVLREVQVPNFAVDPSRRRKGIGTRLLEEVWERAVEGGAEEMTLEVRKSNTAALEFYRKQGFEPERVRPGFYSDPAEDAICLVRRRLRPSRER